MGENPGIVTEERENVYGHFLIGISMLQKIIINLHTCVECLFLGFPATSVK